MTRPRKIRYDHHAARRAFTLVELLVVIAIIGLLSTVAVAATSSSGRNARNAKRKADLVQLSKALELYYADNGVYPSTSGSWWGVSPNNGSHDDSGANGWVPSLAPTYIGILPRDPHTLKGNAISSNPDCGLHPEWNNYVYRSVDGTDYKLLAFCTPEGIIPASDPLNDPNAGRTGYVYAVYSPGAANW